MRMRGEYRVRIQKSLLLYDFSFLFSHSLDHVRESHFRSESFKSV